MTSADNDAELAFIPLPGKSHLVSAVEIAKLLIARDHRVSITVLIMKFPFDQSDSDVTSSFSAAAPPRLRFVSLPPLDESTVKQLLSNSPGNFMSLFIDSYKSPVRDLVSGMMTRTESTQRLAGFTVDLMCTPMMDVAAECGLPSFVLVPTCASFLGLILHVQAQQNEFDYDVVTKLKDSVDTELVVPAFANSVPAKVLLNSLVVDENSGSRMFSNISKKLREAKGIVIQTFAEFESHALASLTKDEKIPTVYPVGPVLNLGSGTETLNPKSEEIMRWLDDQPSSSVVFLCFGGLGSFGEEQVQEIARALENSGHRFLWSLRQSPPKGKFEPGEYENVSQVLPEGFLERTAGVGKVIGWAPQMTVLSHQAVGGFVSHCGWNSMLEGMWCGVPVAAWPMYADQPLIAFLMVRELGLAVELRMDYRRDFMTESEVIVTAEEIVGGIRQLMENDEIKEKVKKMSEKSRIAVAEGGSSYISLGRFIEDAIGNKS